MWRMVKYGLCGHTAFSGGRPVRLCQAAEDRLRCFVRDTNPLHIITVQERCWKCKMEHHKRKNAAKKLDATVAKLKEGLRDARLQLEAKSSKMEPSGGRDKQLYSQLEAFSFNGNVSPSAEPKHLSLLLEENEGEEWPDFDAKETLEALNETF